MSEHDARRIIRQWDREIDEEIRRAAERNKDAGWWRIVSWTALWLLWLLFLVALIVHSRSLR